MSMNPWDPISYEGGGGGNLSEYWDSLTPEQLYYMNQELFYERYPGGIPGVGPMPGENGNDMVNAQIPPWMLAWMNGQGGGGGRGGRRGGGGGRNRADGFMQYMNQFLRGYNQAMDADPFGSALEGRIQGYVDNPLAADPRWQNALFDLNQEIAARGGRLADLSDEDAARLESMTQAERDAAGYSYDRAQEQMVAQLWAGAGGPQSSIALDQTRQQAMERSIAMGQIEAAGNQRNLDLRTELAAQFLQSAGIRSDTLARGGDLNLQDVALQQAERDRTTDLYAMARDQATRRTESARSAVEFDRDAAIRRSQIAADRAASRMQYNLGMSELMYKDQWFQQEQAFNRDRFREDIRQFDLGFGLDRQALAQNQYQYNREARNARRQQTLSTLTTLVGIAAMFSDERLKDHIVEIKAPVELVRQLRGVTWDWLEDIPGGANAGVIAQEVESVFPQAVVTLPKSGAKVVNYAALTGLLVQSMNELIDKVARLEAAQGAV